MNVQQLPQKLLELIHGGEDNGEILGLEEDKISSLTVERVKRGYKPSKYGRCSLFRSCIDMCYILSLSKTFVFLMRVRMEVLVMIS